MEHNLSLLCMCTEMPPNHWFERHICGTNGAVAQLCQNSPQKSCCVVVHDYWTGHLYMHIQQRVWYPPRLLWPLAFKAALYCLVCNPHRLSFRASSVEAEVWWGKREGEERESEGKNERANALHSVQEKAQHFQKASMFWPQCFDLMNHSSKATTPWPPIIPILPSIAK